MKLRKFLKIAKQNGFVTISQNENGTWCEAYDGRWNAIEWWVNRTDKRILKMY